MIRRFQKSLVAAALLVVAVCVLAVVPTTAKDEKEAASKGEDAVKTARKLAMKAFMRKKLVSSQEVIEGLALEDFELIERGAKSLKAMSVAAEFMVTDDPPYREHSDEFRKAIIKMEKAAREKRIDGATLGFLDMTMCCVECHKYVRATLVSR